MSKRLFKLVHAQARSNALQAIKDAPDGFVVVVAEPTRSLDANAAMWAILQAFADQLQWVVNGEKVWMPAEDWKALLSAAFKRETVRVAQGLEGGMVMLGSRTSKFSVREMSDFIEFLSATAVARDVDLNYMEHA
jgi:class 3 adenylate cyclase